MGYSPNPRDDMIPSPEFEELNTTIAKLRGELSALYLEHDHLLYQECRMMEAVYMTAVGALEYKSYELVCKLLRLKRKRELIQARQNRQKEVNIEELEATLDREFADYQAMLNEKLEKMNEALNMRKCKPLSDKENREFRQLYLTIVKALHPDLHPRCDKAQKQLFLNAVDAYKLGDLDSMRIIATLVSTPEFSCEETDSMTVLRKEKERLEDLLQCVKDAIIEIQSRFPYTMKAFLLSPEKIKARQEELQKQIDESMRLLKLYDKTIKEMLG